MTELRLPFQHERDYDPAHLATYYRQLHESDQSAFVDSTTGLTVVWRYPDVQRFMKAPDPAISNENSLDPLVGYAELARHPANWRSMAHLLLRVTPTTANAPSDPHDAVRRVLIDRHHAASLRAGGTAERYGALVDSQVSGGLERLVRELATGPADFAAAFAGPVAAGVIGDALGYPRHKQDGIEQKATGQASLLGCPLTPAEQAAALSGLRGLSTDAWWLMGQNRTSPTSSIAGLLASPRPHDRPPLRRKIAASAIMNLEAAGFITSSGLLSNSMHYYLGEGRYNWGDFTPDTIQEVQRIWTPLLAWKRKTIDEVILADGRTVITPGTQVLAHIGAANQDPDFFDHPAEVRPERYESSGQAQPLTFGLGVHRCVGESLATLELMRALQAVHAELPDLRLASAALHYRQDPIFRILEGLPVQRG